MSVLKPDFPDHGSPFSRKQERDRKVAAIRAAAAKRISAQGIRGARLEDIAADLGLTKTSISYYYSSKEELAEAVLDQAVEFLEDSIDHAEQHDRPARDQILELFRTYIDQLIEALSGQRALPVPIQELDALSETAKIRISERISHAVGRVNARVEAWRTETFSPLGRSEPATFCLFDLLDWLKIQANEQSLADFRETSQEVLNLLRQGLLTARREAPITAPLFHTRDDLPQIFDRDARNKMKKEAFLKAGARFFNASGFEGLSLAQVAASLGVTRGAFYYHIPDKEAFLDQCLDRTMQTVEDALNAAETNPAELTVIERVLFDLVYLQASGVTPMIRPQLLSALPQTRQKRYQTRLRTISRRVGDSLDEAISKGVVRPVDAATLESLLTSMMFLNGGYTMDAANSFQDWRFSENPQAATNDYMHILLNGLTS